MEKSAVYRINPDNTVETLWSSKEENVYDLLALREADAVFHRRATAASTASRRDRKVTLVAADQRRRRPRGCCRRNIRCWPPPATWAAFTGWAKRPGRPALYEAPVHDAGTAVALGQPELARAMPPAAAIAFRTRSGNSARPDRTWSDWSDPLSDSAGSRIASPNARYIQWKAELHRPRRRHARAEQRHGGLPAAEHRRRW